MNKISCSICRDLMPLVKDDVASPDSRNAVMQHLKTCQACQQLFTAVTGEEIPPLDEGRVLAQIKRQLGYTAIALIFVGALLGVGLANSSLVFYNILIMPTIGALGYFALRRKSYLVPLGMLPFVYVWYLARNIVDGDFAYQSPGSLLSTPLIWGLIYAGLCALGAIVAALLHFAFKKEDTSDAKII
ncbi:MAG: zf-HC2 domain-containing protein [Firmicutes bacterium]|nr:zf-HC2 domain-containing protein [Bacillota bacterium]